MRKLRRCQAAGFRENSTDFGVHLSLGIAMIVAGTRPLVFIAGIVLLSTADAAPADSPEGSSNFASVDWHQVSAPFGSYLLMRGPEGVCGIRFTDFRRLHDSKPATAFHSGEETIEAAYEWRFVKKPDGAPRTSRVEHGTGEVATGPLKGIGRLAFQTRDPVVKCGPLRAYWLPPSSVSFSEGIGCSKARYELAPTNSRTFEEIDVHSDQIQWFRCDEHRRSFQIPAAALSSGQAINPADAAR